MSAIGVALLERCGTGFDALDVAKIWLDYLPAGRIVTAERGNHVPLH